MGEIKSYKDIYGLVYSFHQKYAGLKKDDEAKWTELINESSMLAQKYAQHPFLGALLTDVVKEIDRVARLKK